MLKATILQDVVILGKACPDSLKDGRKTVCIGAYSYEHGFIRIYPTPPTSPMKNWDIVRVPVERDDRDTRSESWKIRGSKAEWDQLDKKIEVVGKLGRDKRLGLVANLIDGCVEDLNEQKRSLGIIRPQIERTYFAERTDYDSEIQTTLLGEKMFKTIKNYALQPRIRYRCTNCRLKKGHDQQLLEWGVYEWIRKNPDNADQVWENLRLNSDSTEIYFFVGNQFLRRTSFMIINVVRVPKGAVSAPIQPLKKVDYQTSDNIRSVNG